MKYTKEQLDFAVMHGVFTQEQKERFVSLIDENFNTVNPLQKFLLYAGALLIISALTWLLGESWVRLGHKALLTIASVYFFAFWGAGIIAKKAESALASNLLFCVSITVVPLITYAAMRVNGFWPDDTYGDFYVWIRGKWVVIELATIAVALPFLIKTKFPFIVFFIAFCLWSMSMDIVPILYKSNMFSWTERARVSVCFGALMLAGGYLMHLKYRRDYAFWMYVFALIALTSGLSVFYNDDACAMAILLAVHVLLCFVSLFLRERVFMVFGVIGTGEFLSRISYKFFEDSIMFPFALTIIGCLLIFAGIVYQKNRKKIDLFVNRLLPAHIRKYMPH